MDGVLPLANDGQGETGGSRPGPSEPNGISPLEIVIVALNYPPSVGGAQELMRRIATGLVLEGHRVTVLTTDSLLSPSARDPGRIESRHDVRDGVVIRRHRTPPVLRLCQRWWASLRLHVRRVTGRLGLTRTPALSPFSLGPLSPSLWVDVWRSCRRADVIVGGPVPFTTLITPSLFRRRRGAKVIAVPLFHGGRLHRSVRWALRRADAVVAMTQAEAKVIANLGVPATATRVIPPGADPDRYPDQSAAAARARLGLPERPTVGYVGRIATHKGVNTLLEAAPVIWAREPDLTVLLAGSATGWTGYQAVLERYADSRIIDLGPFDDAAGPDIIAACDVVVFASEGESFGMVILEAWCARRPVVVADIAVSREVVADAGAGTVIGVGDSPALAAAVLDYLANPQTATTHGAAGREAVSSGFTWGHTVQRWNRLVRAIANR